MEIEAAKVIGAGLSRYWRNWFWNWNWKYIFFFY